MLKMCQQTHLGFPWKGLLKQAVQASKAGLHRFWFGGYSSSTGMRGEKEAAILKADAEKQAAILKAEAEKQAAILKADGEAQAIMAVQKAMADSLALLNEKAPNDQVLKLKALEAMQKVADGKATKIIIPSELQGFAGLASGIAETVKETK